MSTENQTEHDPRLLALDTGGTMTDSFIVDEEANYTVGKAQTTPEDESVGVKQSFDNGLGYWDTSFAESAASLDGVVYAGTAMLNRLLEREGTGDIGVITTAGFEDHHRMGRGIASWADLSYAGRLHAREHEHPEPLVPRENINGVRERVNMLGAPAISVYEDEIREAVHDLLDRDVRVICVCMIFSYANQAHEKRVQEIAEEIKDERDDDTPVWLSSEQNPVRGETPRLNTLILEAYAVEPSREQLFGIEDTLRDQGLNSPFRVLTSSGGTIAPDHDWLAETMLSGPIGGVFGGEFLADKLGIDNMVCSDVGGTSFDVALITEGHYPTRWDQTLAQIPTNIPMTALDSIGSGTGSYLRVDRASDRIEVGPDSAGYLVGVANENADVTTPTVTDCTALLGYINPDFFLGGDIPIDVEAAREAIDDQLASNLGEDPVETARGVLDIVERDMANELRSMVHGLGYAPENYNLISYGGGGPLHAAGYTKPLEFKDILVPDWAAAFSAFGTACADSAYRYDQSVDIILQPDFSNAGRGDDRCLPQTPREGCGCLPTRRYRPGGDGVSAGDSRTVHRDARRPGGASRGVLGRRTHCHGHRGSRREVRGGVWPRLPACGPLAGERLPVHRRNRRGCRALAEADTPRRGPGVDGDTARAGPQERATDLLGGRVARRRHLGYGPHRRGERRRGTGGDRGPGDDDAGSARVGGVTGPQPHLPPDAPGPMSRQTTEPRDDRSDHTHQ